jgi:peptide/nickel transport system permease protein
MTEYILRRLLLGVLTAFLVSILVFTLLRIAPGDVVDAILGGEGEVYSDEVREALREQLGLNRPLPIQYLTFMRDFVTLQWGESLRNNTQIWPQIQKKLPITLELSVMTLLISVLMGIPIGTLMALYRDSWIDYILRVLSLAGLSIPNFWTATMIVLGGAFFLNWSPRLEYISPLEDPRANFIMFFWPALAAGWVGQATQARMMRSTMLEVLRQDYIRTAHAKGLRYYVVVYRHALKNALLPVITIIGITVALILGGTVIIESIFQLPGLSRYLVESLRNWDYTVVQTVVLFLSIWIVLSNLVVDLAYGWLDPRIRYD